MSAKKNAVNEIMKLYINQWRGRPYPKGRGHFRKKVVKDPSEEGAPPREVTKIGLKKHILGPSAPKGGGSAPYASDIDLSSYLSINLHLFAQFFRSR